MRNKEEQLKKSFEIIEEQAKELVEVYGWNKEHVQSLSASLKRHARQEVESFYNQEDVSECWNLATWGSDLKTTTRCNFKELESIDMNEVYKLRTFVYEVVDMFKYIENIKLDEIEFIAEYKDKKSIFGIRAVDGKYLVWDLNQVQQAVETRGIFEVVKKIYNKVLEKNNEITGAM